MTRQERNEMQEAGFELLSQASDFVATITGLKQQLIDAGWSPLHAEMIVIHLYTSQGGSK